MAADDAFDAGAVIIAANGNNGPGVITVNAPANAHRGSAWATRRTDGGNQIASQSRGPTADSRFKPDVQAPTNTETASNASGHRLGGSSAERAVPRRTPPGPQRSCATGCAGRRCDRPRSGLRPDRSCPGRSPTRSTTRAAAGRLRLPTDGWAWWGKVQVYQRQDGVEIPIGITGANARTSKRRCGGRTSVSAFWASTIDAHSDIDLQPRGSGRHRCELRASRSASVYERACVRGRVVERHVEDPDERLQRAAAAPDGVLGGARPAVMAPRAGDDDVGPHAKGVFAEARDPERPEPERVLRGVLRRRPTAAGPGDRSALAFTLVTDEAPGLRRGRRPRARRIRGADRGHPWQGRRPSRRRVRVRAVDRLIGRR